MRLSCSNLDQPYKHPFGLSRWTTNGIKNILVELEYEGVTGRGEGAPNKRYDESQKTGIHYLESIESSALENLDSLRSYLDKEQAGNLQGKAASVAALDIAYYDLLGKVSEKSVAQLFEINKKQGARTSFTISIDSIDKVKEKTKEASQYPIVKVKMGTDQDEDMLSAIRSVSDQIIRVDANEGWTDRELALRKIEWLGKHNVELVEQPMPAGMLDDMAWIKERSEMPLFADEDCKSVADMDLLSAAFEGVNVKVDKSGGLKSARNLIVAAKDRGLKVMVGCMGATSLSITAAAHIAIDAEYLDLDGHLLLADDPFSGVYLEDGKITLPDTGYGLGVVQK